jgi:ribosomal protein S18 acetylase RimI-like enzyme
MPNDQHQFMIHVVSANETHFPIIQHIAHQTWPVTFGSILSQDQISYMLEMMYSLPALREQVTHKGHVFLLAQEGTDYLGYASYELNYTETSKTKLHKIYVLPTSQGKGIGKILINAVVEKALQYHNQSLLLNVNRENKAISFYQKLGFKIIGEENIAIGNGFLMEDYVMEKKLITSDPLTI